ncbi:putative hydrolase [Austwickia chelonae NBRC 105200]|uniref:Putative hydrolase n=1 Tax=Austwickia chelonae NBRC 105200 TaxID=1184607 RepID=K6VR24_9MICO|nr:putative hydrolase [Austwickia chelonae NBRC 105200]
MVAHGLGESIATTRPFASGVPGRKVFFHFRGHGASVAPPGPWTYLDLADDLMSVVGRCGADRVLGVSMGAGAVCAALARDPSCFARAVLMLPAVLDRARDETLVRRSTDFAELLESGDPDRVAAALVTEHAGSGAVPGERHRWAEAQARWLLDSTGVVRALRELPCRTAVADRAELSSVRVPVLVVAQEDDPVHPVSVAGELAEILPGAHLEVFPPGGLLWAHRVKLRAVVGEFLGDNPQVVGPQGSGRTPERTARDQPG